MDILFGLILKSGSEFRITFGFKFWRWRRFVVTGCSCLIFKDLTDDADDDK